MMDGGYQPRTAGLVGPNAVIQLGRALRDGPGDAAARAIYAEAGHKDLLDNPPEEMTSQHIVQDLYDALWRCRRDATQIATEAGTRTADYICANRIPKVARVMLGLLPRAMAASLLMRAIQRNAWTFAGSGTCGTSTRPNLIEITDNPIAMPDCAWHRAVFVRLFQRLVSSRAEVSHTACCRDGHLACRFEIVV